MTATSTTLCIERRPIVSARTGLPRTTLYEHVARGLFPPPIHCAERNVGWPAHETDAIIAARIRGDGDAGIRALVAALVARRKDFRANTHTPTP